VRKREKEVERIFCVCVCFCVRKREKEVEGKKMRGFERKKLRGFFFQVQDGEAAESVLKSVWRGRDGTNI